MKLLFDENLSPKLAKALEDIFPESSHVEACGLGAADDRQIWVYARDHGYAIASKDSDFYNRSVVEGAPPKIVWLQVGNYGTTEIAQLLRRFVARIHGFNTRIEESCLTITARRTNRV